MPTENCANLCVFFYFFLFVFLKWRKIFNEVNIKNVFVNIKKTLKKSQKEKTKRGRPLKINTFIARFPWVMVVINSTHFQITNQMIRKKGRGGLYFYYYLSVVET